MKRNNQSYKFIDSAIVNDNTYYDYLNRFKRIALSMFEWVNLPKSMDSRYLELCLYFNGQAALLKDKKYGFRFTDSTSSSNNNRKYLFPTDNSFSQNKASLTLTQVLLCPFIQ